ncbi:hypothetical protein DMC30DRAFT_28526 [Rhodotorula diobovata]|uniref:Uncharacterized protein n=1 Tax=Rhodotorula diobovata TaxID=5288 RepID=A0A5C5FQ67_9BASI|nr:hypothetical protein DMC30DRAFT_28526 [Rhodotorula diobovata]
MDGRLEPTGTPPRRLLDPDLRGRDSASRAACQRRPRRVATILPALWAVRVPVPPFVPPCPAPPPRAGISALARALRYPQSAWLSDLHTASWHSRRRRVGSLVFVAAKPGPDQHMCVEVPDFEASQQARRRRPRCCERARCGRSILRETMRRLMTCAAGPASGARAGQDVAEAQIAQRGRAPSAWGHCSGAHVAQEAGTRTRRSIETWAHEPPAVLASHGAGRRGGDPGAVSARAQPGSVSVKQKRSILSQASLKQWPAGRGEEIVEGESRTRRGRSPRGRGPPQPALDE